MDAALIQENVEISLTEMSGSYVVNGVALCSIIVFICGGATEKGACHKAGIAYSSFMNWKTKSPTLYRMILAAKEVAKSMAIESMHAAATQLQKARKTTTTFKEEIVKGTGEIVTLKTVSNVEEEVPPDWKASKAYLEMVHPEEFGRIDREKAISITSESGMGQVEDIENLDETDIEALAGAIDMMLEKGRFVVKQASIDDEYELAAGIVKEPEIDLTEFDY